MMLFRIGATILHNRGPAAERLLHCEQHRVQAALELSQPVPRMVQRLRVGNRYSPLAGALGDDIPQTPIEINFGLRTSDFGYRIEKGNRSVASTSGYRAAPPPDTGHPTPDTSSSTSHAVAATTSGPRCGP